jgi:hypothetical protein
MRKHELLPTAEDFAGFLRRLNLGKDSTLNLFVISFLPVTPTLVRRGVDLLDLDRHIVGTKEYIQNIVANISIEVAGLEQYEVFNITKPEDALEHFVFVLEFRDQRILSHEERIHYFETISALIARSISAFDENFPYDAGRRFINGYVQDIIGKYDDQTNQFVTDLKRDLTRAHLYDSIHQKEKRRVQ